VAVGDKQLGDPAITAITAPVGTDLLPIWRAKPLQRIAFSDLKASIAAPLSFQSTTGGNLLIGSNAPLLHNNAVGAHDGDANTAIGFSIWPSATYCAFSVAIGFASQFSVTGNAGGVANSLTSVGAQSLTRATTATGGVAMGTDAGGNITTATNFVTIGRHSLSNLGSGINLTGNGFVAIGDSVGLHMTGLNDSVLIGFNNSYTNPNTVNQSNLIGSNAAFLATNVTLSDVCGYQACSVATEITETSLFGYRSHYGSGIVRYCVGLGKDVMYQDVGSLVTNIGNVAIGYQSGYYVSGSNNSFYGYRTGAQAANVALSGVVLIGYRAGDVAAGASAIGNNDFVLANNYLDASRLMWGNFTAATLNLRSSALTLVGNPVYANNAAALAGGLTAGMVYHTAAGALNVVV